MSEANDYGERKHETCRFGVLTKAFRIEVASGAESPALMPLCQWQPTGPTPPALKRAWGGAVEFDRDCAVCLAHQVVQAEGERA